MRPLALLPLLDRIEARGPDAVWISRRSRDKVRARHAAAPEGPLRGATFAVKDNLDLAGLPTTAACPDFAYSPALSAAVVTRLEEAGAVALGKTNLDQFATGLVGVRSPYGVPINPFNTAYIPGGSSSGSAVAVAAGLCDFALGTDTAGSGRVPAAFNGLVGLKPTPGLLSTRGLVPACRSLDCVSIFTRSVADAAEVLAVAAGYDPHDPYSRRFPGNAGATEEPDRPPRLGVPRADQLEFFGDGAAAALFQSAVDRWRALGAPVTEIDYAPFLATARLLYEGPWVAERYAALRSFIETRPESLHPITRRIIEGGRTLGAVETFEAGYRLAELRRRTESLWQEIDALLTPTVGTAYTLAQVAAEPIALNSNLGRYTNHMNLLGLCGLALPAGLLPSGVPWGVTLAAPAFHDDALLRLGAPFLGETPPPPALLAEEPDARLIVCGAHMEGLPLNGRLRRLGAVFEKRLHTAPVYRLHLLGGAVPRPGLVRVPSGGAAIEAEAWRLAPAALGELLREIPAPLGLGTVLLENGDSATGFLCEAAGAIGAEDITAHGGWRSYLRARSAGGLA